MVPIEAHRPETAPNEPQVPDVEHCVAASFGDSSQEPRAVRSQADLSINYPTRVFEAAQFDERSRIAQLNALVGLRHGNDVSVIGKHDPAGVAGCVFARGCKENLSRVSPLWCIGLLRGFPTDFPPG